MEFDIGFSRRSDEQPDLLAEFLQGKAFEEHGCSGAAYDDPELADGELNLLHDFLCNGDEFSPPGQLKHAMLPAHAQTRPAHSGDTNHLAAPTFTGSVATGDVGGSVHGPHQTFHGGALAFRALNGGGRTLEQLELGPLAAGSSNQLHSMGGSVHGGAGGVVNGMPLASFQMLGKNGKRPAPTPSTTAPFPPVLSLPQPLQGFHPAQAPLGTVMENRQMGNGMIRTGGDDEGARRPSSKSIHETSTTPRAAPAVGTRVRGGGVKRTGRSVTVMPKGVKRETLAATVGVPSSDKMYHPQVEKARRDRINRLLNELRVLVPCAPDQLTNGVDKRPKHIVLQDTIELLKRMLSPSPGMFHVHIGPHLGGAGGGVSSGTQQGDSSGNEHATVLQSVPFSSDDAEDLSWAAQ